MAEENVEVIVEEGAVDALVQHLRAPISEEEDGSIAYEHEVEKDAAFALGLLAVKVHTVPFNNQDLTESVTVNAMCEIISYAPVSFSMVQLMATILLVHYILSIQNFKNSLASSEKVHTDYIFHCSLNIKGILQMLGLYHVLWFCYRGKLVHQMHVLLMA